MGKMLSWILAGALTLAIGSAGLISYLTLTNPNSTVAKDLKTPVTPPVAKDVITPDSNT